MIRERPSAAALQEEKRRNIYIYHKVRYLPSYHSTTHININKQHHQEQPIHPPSTIQPNPTPTTKMQFSLLLLAATVSAIRVSYDEGYDDPSRSLTSVACSDGPNGLITTHGFQTQGQIPGFPNIGGSFEIAGWGSAQVSFSFPSIYRTLS